MQRSWLAPHSMNSTLPRPNMRNTSPILLVACLLALCAMVSHGATPPQNVRVLSCITGGGAYATVNPGPGVSMNVSPKPTGSPSLCGLPGAFPQDYYVKTTLDGGKTWQWTYLLSDFGFVKPTPPVTPPVTPPPVIPPVTPTCPDTFVPMNWTCSTANGIATCTAPVKSP
jgi:hypothetical protein